MRSTEAVTATLEQLSDRMEIADLLNRYCACIDGKDWPGLNEVFTPDAVIDYTQTGGARGTLPEIRAYLAEALDGVPSYQHMISNVDVRLDPNDGDRATARCICHNPFRLDVGGRERVMTNGFWYIDEFVRTADGWRIRQRVQQRCYVRGPGPIHGAAR